MGATLRDLTDEPALLDSRAHCERCGKGALVARPIQSAFWRGAGLFVIRNIPAMVCTACGEEYISDRTAIGIDRMRGAGFTAMRTAERMIVPVLDFADPGDGT